MHGELMLKLFLDADIALGSEPANGNYSMWCPVWDSERRRVVPSEPFKSITEYINSFRGAQPVSFVAAIKK
jgi:hypothetical protein